MPGVLDDYAFVANAALDAWEASGEMRYYDAAKTIAEAMIARFYDVTGCGFFDTELNSSEERIGSARGAAETVAGRADAGRQCGCGNSAAAAGGADQRCELRGAGARRRWRRLRVSWSTSGCMQPAMGWRCGGLSSRRYRCASSARTARRRDSLLAMARFVVNKSVSSCTHATANSAAGAGRDIAEAPTGARASRSSARETCACRRSPQ